MSTTEMGPARAGRARAGGTTEGPRVRGVDRVRMRLIRPLTRLLNARLLAVAGSRRRPAFAVVHHRGRQSGRVYATPVSARPTADGFVIPLTFGEGADWCRNVRAAGGCVIEWNGAEYPVVEPEVVGRAAVRSAFSRGERLALRLVGIDRFLRLRRAPASGSDGI